MKIKCVSLSALLCFAVVSLAMPQVLPAAETGAPGAAATPESGYTVRKGDTLWDISRSHLKDPFQWPQIWKKNPSITDPDLIYPGEKLVLPGLPGTQAAPEAAEEKPAAPKMEIKAEEPFVEKGITILKTRKEGEEKIISLDEGKPKKTPIATESDILRAGFIARSFDGARDIVAGVLGDRALFVAGDELYVQDTGGLNAGDRFVACRPGPRVTIPGTVAEYGRVMHATGVVELTGKRDNLFVGAIKESFSDINKSDLLFPVTAPDLVYEPVPENEKLNGAWAYVLASKDDKVVSADGDILYIGLGAKDGVKPGDIFAVRRSGGSAPLADTGHYIIPAEYVLPDVLAGTVQVISVQQETATVKVMSSEESVRAGYRAYYTH
jgi:LysM repeat protein